MFIHACIRHDFDGNFIQQNHFINFKTLDGEISHKSEMWMRSKNVYVIVQLVH